MTHNQYVFAVKKAPKYNELDVFVSDMLASVAFLPSEDDAAAEPEMSLVSELHMIWMVLAAPFCEFFKELDMTQKECADRFLIPYRTVQNWVGGINRCAPYTRLMMAELCGLIKRDEL